MKKQLNASWVYNCSIFWGKNLASLANDVIDGQNPV